MVSNPELVVGTFSKLSRSPTEVTTDHWTFTGYWNVHSGSLSVNMWQPQWSTVRYNLPRVFGNIPLYPTITGCFEGTYSHIKRCSFIARYLWDMADECSPVLPSFEDWGWKVSESGRLLPIWTENISSVPYDNLQLKCTCRGKTRVHVKHARCLPLCKCKGQCTKDRKESSSDSESFDD